MSDAGILWANTRYDGPPMPSGYPFGGEKVQASRAVPTFGFWSSFRADGAKAYWRHGRASWPTRRQRRLCRRTGHPEAAIMSHTVGREIETVCLRCRAVLYTRPTEFDTSWRETEPWPNPVRPTHREPLIKRLRYGVTP
jgi:hypothetical protein